MIRACPPCWRDSGRSFDYRILVRGVSRPRPWAPHRPRIHAIPNYGPIIVRSGEAILSNFLFFQSRAHSKNFRPHGRNQVAARFEAENVSRFCLSKKSCWQVTLIVEHIACTNDVNAFYDSGDKFFLRYQQLKFSCQKKPQQKVFLECYFLASAFSHSLCTAGSSSACVSGFGE